MTYFLIFAAIVLISCFYVTHGKESSDTLEYESMDNSPYQANRRDYK